MKQRLLTYIKTAIVTVGLVAMPMIASPASAIDVFTAGCQASGSGSSSSGGASSSGGVCGVAQQDDFKTLMGKIINTLLIVLGMIAVIMIVIGGIRYTTSNGDSAQIKSAKDTILYAVVGLVVAIMAYAIVNFVLASVKK
ncbi:MAG: rane protein of unknown function [Candidatus Saccharibacteria bacterium]|nr:rane protein of unknown function [Candidatus Saccharibacteria bacterium]